MAVSDAMEKLGRAIFEAPFGATQLAKDAPELAEIRLAVLDAVKAKSYRASGKFVFPYNLVRIRLLGVPESEAGVFRSEFLSNYFTQELKSGLSRSNYRFPADLHIEMLTTPELPSAGQQWLTVEAAADSAKSDASEKAEHKRAKLVIISGTANRPEMILSKVRTNIGRTAEVFRAAGPSRRNDLAFSEESEINRSVSREHAHILLSQKTGEFRIFNDRTYKGEASCGLWIVRDGLSQPVHRGSRGTLLRPGDEIHLAKAVIRFHSKSGSLR